MILPAALPTIVFGDQTFEANYAELNRSQNRVRQKVAFANNDGDIELF